LRHRRNRPRAVLDRVAPYQLKSQAKKTGEEMKIELTFVEAIILKSILEKAGEGEYSYNATARDIYAKVKEQLSEEIQELQEEIRKREGKARK